MPSTEKQTIGRAKLYGVLTAVENKTRGVPLHVVTVSETVYAGLMEKCAKWDDMGWWGHVGRWRIGISGSTCGVAGSC